MRKILSCLVSALFASALTLGFLFLQPACVHAQCGTTAFAGPGNPYTPNAAWQNATPTGSGTYQTFNVAAGNIYSFEFTSATTNLNYDWDMTLSSSSAIIGYDNINTPIPNSYTGGIACPTTTRPASAVWDATYSGTVLVNVNTWTGACAAYVPGQTSATLQYRECVPNGDIGPGLGGYWNVDAFATTAITIPNYNARWGHYIDTMSKLDFNTQNYWTSTGVPSDASDWIGCPVSTENFAIRARRKGFPCGIYQIVDQSSDDSIGIYLNGTQLFAAPCCIGSATVVGDPNGYVLGANDIAEIRLTGVCGSNQCNIQFVPLSVPVVNGGTIADTTNSTYACTAEPIGTFTNVTSASGGVSTFSNGQPLTYQWQISYDGGNTFHNISGATSDFWQAGSADTVPAGLTYVVRREAIDECGDVGYSDSIVLIGVVSPNGSLTPASQTICPNSNATLTVNFTAGLPPYNIVYTDGNGNFYSANNLNSGDVVTVTPLTTTTYSFVSITDAHGCTRTQAFNGSAVVFIEQQLIITSVNVDSVLCFGGNSGSITVFTSGGVPPLTYSAGGSFQSSSLISGLSAGSYNVEVQDNIGCQATYVGNPVTIGQPTALTESLTEVDASCSNVNNGCITVTAGGGSPPYNYAVNGGPSQVSNNLCGLPAGTYVADVIDRKGCLDTASITINNSYVVSLVVDSSGNETCFGSGNGYIGVHLVGGTPPFSYSLNGVTYQASGLFTGLVAGTYTIVGKDVKGCTEFATITITQPAQLNVILDSVKNSTCNTINVGAIYTHATGGTPGYTFAWSNGETSPADTALAGGTYTVLVTDTNGCTATNSAIVTQAYPLSLNIALFTNPLCNNDSTGSILATANGGAPPYNYLWSNSETTQDIDSIPAGVYTLTVTDAFGCQNSISQTLDNPAPITDVITATGLNCYGVDSGSATVTPSGGTPGYTYIWSNFQTTPTVTGLGGGTYSVQIRDHNGCIKWDTVTVSEPAPLTVALTVTNVSCFNANDGSILATPSGGTPQYNYTWNPSETGPNPMNLPGGTYCLTVTDAHSCSVTACGNVINPEPIVITFNIKNALCFGDSNGAIYTTVSGGFPGYTFDWSNGFTTQNITNLAGGPAPGGEVYTLSVTDSHSCSAVDSAVVYEPGALYTSGIIHNVSCHNNCDGSIITTPYGGTVPYSFTWSNNETTENIVQLCGGNYQLTLTDANQCSVVSLYIVNNPPQLTLSVLASNNSCFASCNGTVVGVPGGGTPPYTYLWNNFVSDSLQSNVCAGFYTMVLTDSNGCRVVDTGTVSQPAAITITGSVTDILCNGANTGAINTTVTGGVTPYGFSWSNNATTQSLSGLDSNTYVLTVTDANNCIQMASFNVTQPTVISSAVSLGKPLCHGGGNGFVSVDVTGGVEPYTYNWSTTPVQSGATASNLYAGNYTLTITDHNGCSATVQANLPDPNPIDISTISIGSKCFNSATGGVIASVTSGGTPPYTYLVNGQLESTDTFSNLAPGAYTIIVIDANGCQGTASFTVTSPPSYTVSLAINQSDNGQYILTGMSTQLIATVTPDTGIIHYIWSPDSLVQFTDCPDSSDCPNPFVAPTSTTTFMVSVENSDSCFVSDTITVYVEEQPVSFIPTAFTPNGDGLNDRFEFAILGAQTIEISIFDRWGERVYYNPNQTNGMTNTDGWDGTNNGKPAPEGTYVYQMKITYFDGTVKDRAGTVAILR